MKKIQSAIKIVNDYREMIEVAKKFKDNESIVNRLVDQRNNRLIRLFNASKLVRKFRVVRGFFRNLSGSYVEDSDADYSGYSYREYKLYGPFALQTGYGFNASSLERWDGGQSSHSDAHKWCYNPLMIRRAK